MVLALGPRAHTDILLSSTIPRFLSSSMQTKFNLVGFLLVMTAAALAGLRWTITQVRCTQVVPGMCFCAGVLQLAWVPGDSAAWGCSGGWCRRLLDPFPN